MQADIARGKRAVCERCLRAQSACICQWITPLVSSVELLILQHPLEVGNAKNSARLLQLSVSPSVMVVGEMFDAAALAAMLEEGGRTPVLLYPDTPGDRSLGIAPPPPLDPSVLSRSRLRLVIVDATWRKSRKMLYLNPALQALPRYTLRAMPPSHYRIRKAHAPDQLSTLEAAAYALMQVDAEPARFQALLEAFDGFVGQQLRFVPGAA
jgi:DTW domain-containing protein YfiP